MSITQQRRAREKQNLRRAILDAARELFVEEDYKSVSIRKIADKIEYSPTSIYLHFKDKVEIFFELMKEGNDILAARLEAGAVEDPLQTLRAGLTAYLQFASEEPHYYKIMFSVEDEQMIEFCEEHLEEICGRSFGFLLLTVQRLQAAKIYQGPYDDLMLSHVLWAWLHGAAMLILSQRLKWLPDSQHEGYKSNVVDSVIQYITQAK